MDSTTQNTAGNDPAPETPKKRPSKIDDAKLDGAPESPPKVEDKPPQTYLTRRGVIYDEETWLKVRDAYVAGFKIADISRMFGPTIQAIRKRVERHHWPAPTKLAKMRKKIEMNKTAKKDLTSALEQLSNEKAMEHRAYIVQLATEKIKQAKLRPPKNWRDMDLVDKMARRSLGLDDGPQQQTLINLGVLGGQAMSLEECQVVDA